MPRKGQRSQSQKLRRQKEKEQVNVSQSSEQVKVCASTFPSTEVQSSVQTATVSYADVVKRGVPSVSVPEPEVMQVIQTEPKLTEQTQHDGETGTVSYADVVKRGVPSVSVPEPEVMQVIQTEPQLTVQTQHDGQAPVQSHVQVTNSESHPRVSSICAARSQASPRYGKYRNQQCMANSLVFLSFLHEDEFITRADLNRVLDKGHAMYSDARKRFVNSVFLACDELPSVVISRRHEYQVDMSQFARYGTFDGTAHLPSLEQGLQCLASEFCYALLVMGGTVIAVCRLTSGLG
ncbi:dopamine receptor D5 [Sarotherodon galilaeus]